MVLLTLFKLLFPIKASCYQTIRSNSKVSYTYCCLSMCITVQTVMLTLEFGYCANGINHFNCNRVVIRKLTVLN